MPRSLSEDTEYIYLWLWRLPWAAGADIARITGMKQNKVSKRAEAWGAQGLAPLGPSRQGIQGRGPVCLFQCRHRGDGATVRMGALMVAHRQRRPGPRPAAGGPGVPGVGLPVPARVLAVERGLQAQGLGVREHASRHGPRRAGPKGTPTGRAELVSGRPARLPLAGKGSH